MLLGTDDHVRRLGHHENAARQQYVSVLGPHNRQRGLSVQDVGKHGPPIRRNVLERDDSGW